LATNFFISIEKEKTTGSPRTANTLPTLLQVFLIMLFAPHTLKAHCKAALSNA
jgi:hypothetical protein